MPGKITEVPGLLVGNIEDEAGRTGVTVVLCAPPAVGALDRRGSAASTRQCDSLYPDHMLSRVDAIVLAGGSAFGLGCSNGVMDELAARGVGMPTPYGTIPIVPTAVIFDIGIGQSAAAPTVEMARAATKSAAVDFAEGSAGAGYGATIGKLLGVKSAMKGGLGTAARHGEKGLIVGALAVVNAWGDIVETDNGAIIAGARNPDKPGEFLDTAKLLGQGKARPASSFEQNTVLAVVATNAKLDKIGCGLIARMAQTGMARAIRPCHSPFDGDLVFALSSGELSADPVAVGQMAADALAEAIQRGVRLADGWGLLPDARG
ncbi:MAG TPA: P1 family peptidase [bacterium]|nr:P1 family peptidase [bacterium]